MKTQIALIILYSIFVNGDPTHICFQSPYKESIMRFAKSIRDVEQFISHPKEMDLVTYKAKLKELYEHIALDSENVSNYFGDCDQSKELLAQSKFAKIFLVLSMTFDDDFLEGFADTTFFNKFKMCKMMFPKSCTAGIQDYCE